MLPPSPPTQAPTPVVRLLPQLVDFAAQKYGEQPFLFRHTGSGWASVSFTEAARSVHALAALLEREGVRPGDRVAIQSENRYEWGLAYLAVLETGAVVVPLDVQLKSAEVHEILKASRVSYCIVSGKQRDVVREALRPPVTAVRLIGLDPVQGEASWADAMRDFPAEGPRPERANPNDLAVLLFTSGTVGRPKGVMLSHSNILHNVEAVARTITILPEDRLLSILPLHHTFECTLGLLCPLRMGAGVSYGRGLKSNELREDLQTSGATILLGVPLLYEKMLAGVRRGISSAPLPRKLLAHALLLASRVARAVAGVHWGKTLLRPLREKAGLGRIRFFACGAAPLPEEVFWSFMDLGLPVLEGYGLTECSPVVAANRPDRAMPGTVGHPVAGVEVRIQEPEEDGTGEIVVRGPNVMLGYHEDPQATADVLRQGWFYTGDLGRFTRQGDLHITGRLKNMIATAAGKKIYPEEIETLLNGSPWILEVVILSGRDARGQREEVHAHVVPDLEALEARAKEEGGTFDDAYVEEQIRREVQARCQVLAEYKRAKRVVVRREPFPRTTTGKIKRHALATQAARSDVGAVA